MRKFLLERKIGLRNFCKMDQQLLVREIRINNIKELKQKLDQVKQDYGNMNLI